MLIRWSKNESHHCSGTILKKKKKMGVFNSPPLLYSKWKNEFYGTDFKSAQKKPRKKALQITVICSVKNN